MQFTLPLLVKMKSPSYVFAAVFIHSSIFIFLLFHYFSRNNLSWEDAQLDLKNKDLKKNTGLLSISSVDDWCSACLHGHKRLYVSKLTGQNCRLSNCVTLKLPVLCNRNKYLTKYFHFLHNQRKYGVIFSHKAAESFQRQKLNTSGFNNLTSPLVCIASRATLKNQWRHVLWSQWSWFSTKSIVQLQDSWCIKGTVHHNMESQILATQYNVSGRPYMARLQSRSPSMGTQEKNNLHTRDKYACQFLHGLIQMCSDAAVSSTLTADF